MAEKSSTPRASLSVERPPELAGPLRLIATFGGAAAILLAAAMTYVAMDRAAAARELVTHTQAVLETASATLVAVQDAETGQRGYLITGDTAYLDPYNSALKVLGADTLALRELMRDNEVQERRLDTLETLITHKLAELDETIALRKAGGRGVVENRMRAGRGKAIMDSIRTAIDAMNDEERRLLDERRVAADRSSRFAVTVLVVGSLAAIVCGLLLNGMLSRYAAVLRGQNTRLSEQATELEAQAEQLQEQSMEMEITNENLTEQMALVEAANAAKSDFLAAVSHELRTPLNAIDGYTELLLLGVRGELNEQQVTDVERIRKSSRHLLTLINQVLNMARIESGQIDLTLADVPVLPLLQDVEVLIAPQMNAKRIRFSIDECSESVRVHADADRVKQILVNLVSNAQKFTDPGGSVTVTSVFSGDGILAVDVVDTGRGIPRDKLTEIFEPFAQLNRLQTPDAHRGIGLGLSISRTLARAMGGDLIADSEVGKGSRFRVTLPLSASTRG